MRPFGCRHSLHGLGRILAAPPMDIEEHLGTEVASMRRAETRKRQHFRDDRDTARRLDPYAGLINVYGGDSFTANGEDFLSSLTFSPEPMGWPIFLDNARDQASFAKHTTPGKPCVAQSFEGFRTNFNHE